MEGYILYGRRLPITSDKHWRYFSEWPNDDMARSIISKTPYTPYGISSVYPQLPDIKPYHNDAVWPFVQAYWNLAAKKAGNMAAFEKGVCLDVQGCGIVWQS